MQEEIRKMVRRVKEAMVEERRVRNRGVAGRWWDECKKGKREMRKELRKWRREGDGGLEFKRKKRQYMELCGKKKTEAKDRWAEGVEKIKEEGKVWEVINVERKRRKEINEEIEEGEWKEYFMGRGRRESGEGRGESKGNGRRGGIAKERGG